MMQLETIVSIVEMILLTYFGFAAIYFLVFAVASLFYHEKKQDNKAKQFKTAVLIPSYKEDEVILETAQSALNHISLSSSLDIYVIADSLQKETVELLEKTRATIVPVTFKRSTKVKSLNRALDIMQYHYDYVVILDADNIMGQNCIDELIKKVQQGFRIVQGHRLAKNRNTRFAVLDGISEEVNNSIFRKGHRVLGLSASIIGSGFICEYNLLKELLKSSKAVGGFDKEIELKIMERKIRIGYAQNALVFDEKIQKAEAFVNQRRRWLAAQIIYFRMNMVKGMVQLFKYRNLDYFDKIIQFMLPPRIIALGTTFLLSVFYWITLLFSVEISRGIFFYAWNCTAFMTALSIMVAIPANKIDWHFFRSVLSIPAGFFYTMVALLKSKGANKRFLHTPHGINYKNKN